MVKYTFVYPYLFTANVMANIFSLTFPLVYIRHQIKLQRLRLLRFLSQIFQQ